VLADNPALVNQDPFGQGWFFKVKLSAPAELGALLTPEQYAAQISGH
jgi:glycine cleavage system H protein